VTVAIAIAMDMAEGILEGRRGTAIGDERRVLVGRVGRPARHLTSDVMVEGWKSQFDDSIRSDRFTSAGLGVSFDAVALPVPVSVG